MPKASWGSEKSVDNRLREKVLVNFSLPQLQTIDAEADRLRVNRSTLIRDAVMGAVEFPADDPTWCRLCRGAHSPATLVRYVRDNSGPDLGPVCKGCIELLASEAGITP